MASKAPSTCLHQQQRRLLFPDDHLRRRDRPRYVAGPGPKPGQQRPGRSFREAFSSRASRSESFPDILVVVSLYSEDDRFEETFLSNYG